MDTKYYTPDISEFHVGFEYEHCHSSIRFVMLNLKTGETSNETEPKEIWEKSVFTGNEFDVWKSSFKFDDSLRDGQIRVKCLDKEDIESLGFKLKVENRYGITFANRLYSIVYSKMKSNHLEIFLTQPYVNEYDGLKFSGVIKNKSELEKLLKQLEITNER